MPCTGGGGAGAAPAAGAATPTIVPLSRLGPPGAPALGAPAPTLDGTGPALGGPPIGAPAAGRGPAAAPGPLWFIINMVPLNFGAALFIENPHLVQV